MTLHRPIDRREFMGRSLAAGTVAATLPAASWGRLSGANEQLRVGVIGCGPQGQLIIRKLIERADADAVSVRRVCDLYRPRLQEAASLGGVPTDLATMEYREVLDDPDIDAVVVATPDHWHAKITTEALEAGKAVLLETPLAHTIDQAVAVRDTARRTRPVLVIAAPRCSDDRYWQLRDAVAQDRIGRVTWSQGAFCVNARIPLFNRPYDGRASLEPDSPDYVWWDRWLGHEWDLAPKTDFDMDRFFHYQKFYDYSNGMAGELLFGVLAPMLFAVAGQHGETPRRVVCGGGLYNLTDTREIPDQIMAVIDYPSGHSIVLVACATNSRGLDVMVRGRHGTATLQDDGLRLDEQAAFFPEFRGSNKDHVDAGMSQDERGRWVADPPAGDVGFLLSPGERRDYLGNFLDSVRGEAKPHCGIELAFATMVSVAMASEALRTDRALRWNADESRLEGA